MSTALASLNAIKSNCVGKIKASDVSKEEKLSAVKNFELDYEQIKILHGQNLSFPNTIDRLIKISIGQEVLYPSLSIDENKNITGRKSVELFLEQTAIYSRHFAKYITEEMQKAQANKITSNEKPKDSFIAITINPDKVAKTSPKSSYVLGKVT